MSILNRIKFALKYDFANEFVVVPYGNGEAGATKFMEYEAAQAFVNETPMEKIPPLIFVAVRKIKP